MILLCQLISLFFIFIKSAAKWFVEVVVEDIAAGAAVHDGSSSSSSRSSSGRGSSTVNPLYNDTVCSKLSLTLK